MSSVFSRPYAGTADLEVMRDLLRASSGVYPYSSIHIGDLDWWVFYDTTGIPLQDKVRLWFDGEQFLAWTWTNWKWGDFDMAVHPAYRGSPYEEVILKQTLETLETYVRQQPPGDDPPSVVGHAYEDETERIAMFKKWGFSGSPYLLNLAQDIRGTLPLPVLPDGFSLLDAIRPEDVEERAAAHKDAFSPHSKMTPDYYRSFMQAPGYDPTLDIAVAAPDGRIAAYVMAWADMDNKLSEFEPVGTRYEFQRRGLGKAALLEGLRRLQARGIKTALVSCVADEKSPLRFYESAGFKLCNRLFSFKKTLE